LTQRLRACIENKNHLNLNPITHWQLTHTQSVRIDQSRIRLKVTREIHSESESSNQSLSWRVLFGVCSSDFPLRAKKMGFPPDSNRERKGQTLKQEAGLYHSAIGAPDMHSQISQQD
ncbi:hypothetical protein PROFUN_14238, partial [Planoprotostelium fungivorum]